MDSRALVIMLKLPEPGSVKTRLVPPLTHDQASRLYELFLEDIFDKVSKLNGVSVYAAYTPEWASERACEVIPGHIEAFPQEGLDLGERMYNAFKRLFDRGFKYVTLIGSDSPDMPPSFIEEAFGLLERSRVVLGPAVDGGYYLIAMDGLVAAPFINMRWSHDRVLKDTIKRLDEGAIGYRLLPEWHDIDRIEDLPLLKEKDAKRSYGFLRDCKILV